MFKKISQFLNSLMLKEILIGMSITGRYLFKPKITIQYPEEKTPLSPRIQKRRLLCHHAFAACMLCAVTRVGKSAALAANSVKQYVPHTPSRLRLMSVMMVLAVPLAMTSI